MGTETTFSLDFDGAAASYFFFCEINPQNRDNANGGEFRFHWQLAEKEGSDTPESAREDDDGFHGFSFDPSIFERESRQIPVEGQPKTVAGTRDAASAPLSTQVSTARKESRTDLGREGLQVHVKAFKYT